jgi:hypothetical protein
MHHFFMVPMWQIVIRKALQSWTPAPHNNSLQRSAEAAAALLLPPQTNQHYLTRPPPGVTTLNTPSPCDQLHVLPKACGLKGCDWHAVTNGSVHCDGEGGLNHVPQGTQPGLPLKSVAAPCRPSGV